jgi:hypothetical protein
MTYSSGAVPYSVNIPNGYTLGPNAIYSGSIYTVGSDGPPLSKEETKELNDLAQERAAASKLLKIAVFKKVPPVLRQQVVNQIYWCRAIKEMSAAEADKSEREKELEIRHMMSKGSNPIYWSHGYGAGSVVSGGGSIQYLQLPEGLTEDELMSAHNEATLEESIADEQAN